MTVLAISDGVNALALVVFAIVLAITLLITYWASKRTRSATEFWAANRGISGLQNGFAIAGDYLSASTFLGFAGLIFLFGVDGWVGLAAAGASWSFAVSGFVSLPPMAELVRSATLGSASTVGSLRCFLRKSS